MTKTRIRRRYDHRLRRLVHQTGDVQLAVQNGVPRSTARDWARLFTPDVVSLEVLSMLEDALQQEVVAHQGLRMNVGIIRRSAGYVEEHNTRLVGH